VQIGEACALRADQIVRVANALWRAGTTIVRTQSPSAAAAA
jgi:hypothetical protein